MSEEIICSAEGCVHNAWHDSGKCSVHRALDKGYVEEFEMLSNGVKEILGSHGIKTLKQAHDMRHALLHAHGFGACSRMQIEDAYERLNKQT